MSDICNDDEEIKQEIKKEIKPSTVVKTKKKKREGTLRKAPQAPKRFKSSYIIFFMAKQEEIKKGLNSSGSSAPEVSKKASELWKALSPEERKHWDDIALKDKQRYMAEKANYTGPWQVPWKRAKKDPSAPKRNPSAFLNFSQNKRKVLRKENPGMRNTEISRLLGDLWRNASEEERKPHIAREADEREKYKIAIAEWREIDARRKEEQRKAQETHEKMIAEQQSRPIQAPYNAIHPYYHDPTQPYEEHQFDYYHQQQPDYVPQGPYSTYLANSRKSQKQKNEYNINYPPSTDNEPILQQPMREQRSPIRSQYYAAHRGPQVYHPAYHHPYPQQRQRDNQTYEYGEYDSNVAFPNNFQPEQDPYASHPDQRFS